MSVRRLAEDHVQPESFAFAGENAVQAQDWIAKYPSNRKQSAVIPLLMLAQDQEGWVTKAAIEHVAGLLEMPRIRVLEVATFYTQFQLKPVGTKAHVQVCGTTPCMLMGAEKLKQVCRNRIHHDQFHVNAAGTLSWEEVECLGACVNAPMVMIFKDTYEDLTPQRLEEIIDAFEAGKGDTITPGPQNGRTFSMPAGGATALTDEAAVLHAPNAKAPEARAGGGQGAALRACVQTAESGGETRSGGNAGQGSAGAGAAGKANEAAKPKSTEPESGAAVKSPDEARKSGSVAAAKASDAAATADAETKATKSADAGTKAASRRSTSQKASAATATGSASADAVSGTDSATGEKNARAGKSARAATDATASAADAADLPGRGKSRAKGGGDDAASDVGAASATGAGSASATPAGLAAFGGNSVSEGDTAAAGGGDGRPRKAKATKGRGAPPESGEAEASTRGSGTAGDATGATTSAKESVPAGKPALDDARRPAAMARPASADDLKRISGIGPKIEGTLNDLGVHTFAQIAEWEEPQRDWVNGYLSFKGRIEREEWVPQAQRLAAEKSGPVGGAAMSATDDAKAGNDDRLSTTAAASAGASSAGPTGAARKASTTVDASGSEASGGAGESGSSAQPGGKAKSAKAAGQSGSEKAATAASGIGKASATGKSGDVAKPATPAKSGTSASAGEEAIAGIQPKGIDKPAAPDNLQMISGVGPKIEGILHSLGIWTFAQIAAWTADERAWVDGHLRFHGRIEREEWVRQADALARGGRDEYVRVFGKEPR